MSVIIILNWPEMSFVFTNAGVARVVAPFMGNPVLSDLEYFICGRVELSFLLC